MEYFQIIVLGIVQGITEFLPISSSGHLILTPAIFGFEDQGLAMDALLHLASLLAIIIFFKKDLWNLLQGIFSSKADPKYKKLGWSIVLASFPAGILGLMGGDIIEQNLRSATFVAWNLIIWSVVFFIADYQSKKQKEDPEELYQLSLGQVMLVGFAQALALFPGTSRSGVTICAGLFSNLSQTAAARFSFLLGTPIIFAAGMHKAVSIFRHPDPSMHFGGGEMLVGFLVCFVVGYFSIKLLLKIVAKVGLLPFIIYRVILAIGILIFFPAP